MLRSQNHALISKVKKPENLGGLAFFKAGGMPRRGIRPPSALCVGKCGNHSYFPIRDEAFVECSVKFWCQLWHDLGRFLLLLACPPSNKVIKMYNENVTRKQTTVILDKTFQTNTENSFRNTSLSPGCNSVLPFPRNHPKWKQVISPTSKILNPLITWKNND